MNRQQILGLVVLCAAVFLVAIDGTVISVAVPAINDELSPTYTQILWIGDIYSFVLASLLVTMGNLGDRFGRRRLLLLAATGFGVMSVAAAVAPTPELLITARALQGVAGAGLMPSTLALLRTIFHDPSLRTRAIGIWSASGAAGAAAGPPVAGLLLEHFYWGSVLLVNVPVVIFIVAVGLAVLPEAGSRTRPRIDVPSVGLSAMGILLSVYGITELAHSGPRFVPAWVGFGLGIPLLWIFLRRQRTLPHPLMDLQLFTDVRFTAAVTAQFAVVLANVGVLFFLPIFLRQVEGFSPLLTGLALVPQALAAVITAPNAGRISARIGARRTLLLGIALGAAGLLALTVTLVLPYPFLVPALVALGASFGLVLTTSSDLVLSSASADRAGAATGISETAFELGTALGIALLGSVVTILYFLITGTSANFTDTVDGAALSRSIQGASALAGIALGTVAAVLAKVLPTRAPATAQR